MQEIYYDDEMTVFLRLPLNEISTIQIHGDSAPFVSLLKVLEIEYEQSSDDHFMLNKGGFRDFRLIRVQQSNIQMFLQQLSLLYDSNITTFQRVIAQKSFKLSDSILFSIAQEVFTSEFSNDLQFQEYMDKCVQNSTNNEQFKQNSIKFKQLFLLKDFRYVVDKLQLQHSQLHDLFYKNSLSPFSIQLCKYVSSNIKFTQKQLEFTIDSMQLRNNVNSYLMIIVVEQLIINNQASLISQMFVTQNSVFATFMNGIMFLGEQNKDLYLPPFLQPFHIYAAFSEIFEHCQEYLSINQVFGKLKKLIRNKKYLKQLSYDLLYYSKITSLNDVLAVLIIQEESVSQKDIYSFLKINIQFLRCFVHPQFVLKPLPQLQCLIEFQISENAQKALSEIIADIINKQFLDQYMNEYSSFIKINNQSQNLAQQINADDYDVVVNSDQFTKMKSYIHDFFANNIMSAELFSLYTQNSQGNNQKYEVPMFKSFKPRFSLSQPNILKLLKYKISLQVFFKLISSVVCCMHMIDQDDMLLIGINKLRNEQLSILQENNLDQNELVNKSVASVKLSIILQPLICQFIDSGNFVYVFQYMESNYCNNIEEIATQINQKISGFYQFLPKFNQYINQRFEKVSNSKQMNNPVLSLPLFVLANCQFKIADQVLCQKLQKYHLGFVQFLLDIQPTVQISKDQDKFYSHDFISKLVVCQDKKFENAIAYSVNNNMYSYDQAAFFLSTISQCRQIDISPPILDCSSNTKNINIKQVQSFLIQNLSKHKKQLLKFIIEPETMPNFMIKEEVMNSKQYKPVQEIFTQSQSQIKDLIVAVASHLLLVDQDQVFFQLLLDYQLLRTYQPAGIKGEVNTTYHYDCLIKDYVLGDNISFTVRKLSTSAFRFFIVLYCSIIFLSSLVFNQYKGHTEHCNIISPFTTLQQDRFIYLISQISNSLNVIANVKGFTERGCVGFCNAVLFAFLIDVQVKENEVDVLEQKIMGNNYDDLLIEFCRIFTMIQDSQTKEDLGKTEEQMIIQQDEFATSQVDGKMNEVELMKQEYRQQNQQLKLEQGKKILFSYKPFSTTNFGDQIELLAQNDVKVADFIRSCGPLIYELVQVTLDSLVLKRYIMSKYSNKYYSFELDSETLPQFIIHEYLQSYAIARHQLFRIQNSCNEQQFPDLSEKAAISSLVLLGDEARDGHSKLAILDEIIQSFCSLISFSNTHSTIDISVEVLYQIKKQLPINQTLFVECINTDFLVNKLNQIFPNNYSLVKQTLPVLKIEFSKQDSYVAILDNNERVLSMMPDFIVDKERYNQIFHIHQSKVGLQKQLDEIFDSIIIGIERCMFTVEQIQSPLKAIVEMLGGEFDDQSLFLKDVVFFYCIL